MLAINDELGLEPAGEGETTRPATVHTHLLRVKRWKPMGDERTKRVRRQNKQRYGHLSLQSIFTGFFSSLMGKQTDRYLSFLGYYRWTAEEKYPNRRRAEEDGRGGRRYFALSAGCSDCSLAAREWGCAEAAKRRRHGEADIMQHVFFSSPFFVELWHHQNASVMPIMPV